MRTAHRIGAVTAAALLGLGAASAPASASTGITIDSRLVIGAYPHTELQVTGSASCDGDGSSKEEVEVGVVQERTQGSGSSDPIPCDGSPHAWKAHLVAAFGTWNTVTNATAEAQIGDNLAKLTVRKVTLTP